MGRRGKVSGSAEEAGEKGGEGVEDAEKEYLRLPGPRLMGSGERGVGGDDVEDSHPTLIFITKINKHSPLFPLKVSVSK